MRRTQNFTPTPVDRKTVKVLFQMTRVIVLVARLRYMPLVLKMATPQQRSWCVMQLAKKESVTAVQRAFRTKFHMEPPSRVFIYAWYKKFEQKWCICIHH
jgi:hypothetical protein